jgi:hypothetical protein
MPEGFLGDGLIFEDALPVTWKPGPLAEGVMLGRLNADNHQLLGAEASLDEVRVHEALKDESPALLHELQRLEYKVNILLRLTAEFAMRNAGLPDPARVRLSSRGAEWFGESLPAVGETGLLSIYINPALPQPLKISCTAAGEREEKGAPVVQLRFSGVSESVIDMLEKLIFRHHRRLVAGARLGTN